MVICLSGKETDHGTGPRLYSRKASSRAVEQREARRREAAAETGRGRRRFLRRRLQ